MDTYRHLVPLLGLAATLLVAGCSGGSAATSGANAPGATSATAPGATEPPGGSASQPPGGGGATSGAGGAGSTPGPAVAVITDACSVLTAADIQAITGATLVGAVPAQQAGIQNGCLFELRDPSSATTTINLGVMPTGGREYYDSQVGQGGLATIEGIGDAAVSPRPGNVLAVAGDVLLSLQYFGPTGPDQATSTEL